MLEYLPLDTTRADEVADALDYCGVAELTQYKTISVLTAIEVRGLGADVKFSDPYTVTAVLTPGITVPEGAELRVFVPQYGDAPAANALTASVMPAESGAASAPTLLDFPAEYDAEASTVTFTTEGEVTIPEGGTPVTIAAVTKSAPAPSGGSGGGGCSAGWGALALLAVVPLFAYRKK